jgi:hypothetical protein
MKLHPVLIAVNLFSFRIDKGRVCMCVCILVFGPMANYSLYSTELLADAAYDGAGGGTSQKGTT